MKKKLLYFSTRTFWPPSTGHEIMLYNNCKGLHEQYGYEIYLICFTNKKDNGIIPEFIHDVKYINHPNKLTVLKNIFSHSLFNRKKWPLQNCLFYSDSILKELQSYNTQVKPDAFFVDMIRLVPYIKKVNVGEVKKVLIAEDDLVKRYQRQLAVSSSGNALGYFEGNTTSAINKLTSANFVKKLMLNMEISRIKSYESELSDQFDYITYISNIDVQNFNQKYHTDKAINLTMGADVEYYSQVVEVSKHNNRSMVFVGNYMYAPNADSIRMICRDIIPKLPKDTIFYVIGKCPAELRNEIESEQVKVMGFVDDIRTVVKSADLYLSPITYGSGIKTKIVEAMAMGMPVVTNSVGAESLAVTSGKELFIADSVEDIIALVNQLMSDRSLREQVGKNGQEYVKEKHAWTEIYKTFAEMGL